MTDEQQKLKRTMGYEDDVPRCQSCRAFRKARWVWDEDVPIRQPAFCSVGRFAVRPLACCDRWVGKRGEKLNGG